jgi:hypothetical protein
MNERKLRNKLCWIVRVGAPLTLVGAGACGGISDAQDAHEGTATGGAEHEGTATGGSEREGTATGGAEAGGGQTGGGAGAAGTAAGGGSGGAVSCIVDPRQTGIGDECLTPQRYEVSAACAVPELTGERCMEMCQATWQSLMCSFSASSSADKVWLTCPPTCVAGRRPDGFVAEPQSARGVAAYFSRMAELEAAAVPAFRHLRAELRERRAPRALLRALSRAARDERRHTRVTQSLARRRGGRVTEPSLCARRPRSLEAIAVENAAEGCVRELFGALLATYQAEHASDLEVRSVMRRIAREETRHAALSLDLQTWIEARLDTAARERVRAARTRALRELAAELDRPPEPELVAVAGLPSPSAAARLYRELFEGAL